MAGNVYPLFRDYSLSVKSWLQKITNIPRLSRIQYNIQKMTRLGTTGGGVNQHEIHVNNTLPQMSQGHAIVVEGTPDNNEYYMIDKVVGNVLILDKNYKMIKAEQTTVVGTVKRTINVVYGNMEKAIAGIAQPLRNGLIDSPGISFYITDYQYKVEKSRPVENYYTRKYTDEDGNILKSAAVPPLQEYQLTYSINVWAVYMQEMDILNYQIISEFTPTKWFWIGDPEYGFEYTGDRMDREHHGQWAHSLLENVGDVSDLEPGSPTRTLRTEIGFVITDAYLPIGFDDEQSMIGSVDFELIIEDRDYRCN